MQQPLIFDIKRYAINDGPGIRITIFFKGCPLSCVWCHNPESISVKPEKMYTLDKCIGCGECVKLCPSNACELTVKGIITNPMRCDLNGRCAAVCPTLATEISGYYQSSAELLTLIEKEQVLFDQSGGGVTFSGGEPLLFPEYLTAILKLCGNQQIHRTIDTCGMAKTSTLLEIAKHTDLFLYDLKLMDSAKHKAYVGIGNEQILANLTALAESGANIQIRIPAIKGVNLDPENIEASARFIANLAGEAKTINLLPYHASAIQKYSKLGKTYLLDNLKQPTATDLQQVVDCFATYGLDTIIGG